MTQPITFIHLTDLHISNPAVAEPHQFQDTRATLEKALKLIRALEPKPSFIAVTGDLANNEDPAAYLELKQIWGDMTDIPVLFALGNHDSRAGFRQGVLGESDNLGAPYDHAVVIDGVHIVTLDTSTPGSSLGTIDDGQFAWLETTLAAHPELPTLILLHHPPALGGERAELSFETLPPEHSERLGALIAGRNVVGILAGHIHQERVSVWNGVPIVIGNGHHSTLDVLHRGGMRMTAGAGMAVGVIRPSGLTVNFIGLHKELEELMYLSFEQIAAAVAKKAS